MPLLHAEHTASLLGQVTLDNPTTRTRRSIKQGTRCRHGHWAGSIGFDAVVPISLTLPTSAIPGKAGVTSFRSGIFDPDKGVGSLVAAVSGTLCNALG